MFAYSWGDFISNLQLQLHIESPFFNHFADLAVAKIDFIE
jgi:hypothetical protein